ncbi:MAG TPA: hypothetical protein VHT05_07460 [Candidatus Elarobacter sp.]|jgi:hypothetical protein|nr:hypothetical protein [Candidatus Elarobacter sp.]
MSTDIASTVATITQSLEKVGVDYVVYRDHGAGNRLVVLLENGEDAAVVRSALHHQGMSSGPHIGVEFVAVERDSSGEKVVELIMKAGSGKAGIPNLLWQAATSESALAARESVREK